MLFSEIFRRTSVLIEIILPLRRLAGDDILLLLKGDDCLLLLKAAAWLPLVGVFIMGGVRRPTTEAFVVDFRDI